eukprot:jgi/Chrpa1/12839/Chrysochromulina_OHIO_Genome00015028-RA
MFEAALALGHATASQVEEIVEFKEAFDSLVQSACDIDEKVTQAHIDELNTDILPEFASVGDLEGYQGRMLLFLLEHEIIGCVRLVGLKSRPELNGRFGRICGELQPTDSQMQARSRWPIEVDFNDPTKEPTFLKLKTANLRPMSMSEKLSSAAAFLRRRTLPDEPHRRAVAEKVSNTIAAMSIAADACNDPMAARSNAAAALEMVASAMPPPFPVYARVLIHGLQSRPSLNGSEACVLGWHADKGRLSIRIVGGACHGEKVLVRSASLARAPPPFEMAPMHDILCLMLGHLGTWTDAARAAAVHPTWRRALKGGAWPARAEARVPERWRDVQRFGCDWEEWRPFARPALWYKSPHTSSPPSWLWALQGMPAYERAPEVLILLDAFEREWPGVLVTRWPGVARRLQWMRGLEDPSLTINDLLGTIPRRRPQLSERDRTAVASWGAEMPWNPDSEFCLGRPTGPLGMNLYRDGGCRVGGEAQAPACPFNLPADVALFFALLPEGYGEQASDGASFHAYCGFEFSMEPWHQSRPSLSTLGLSAETVAWATAFWGCRPEKMLDVAVWEEVNQEDDSLIPLVWQKKVVLSVCCDEDAKDKYGKIVVLVYQTLDIFSHQHHNLFSLKRNGALRDENLRNVRHSWTDVSFIEMHRLVLESARLAMKQKACASDVRRAGSDSVGSDETSRLAGGGKWDTVWAVEHGAATVLLETLLRREVEQPPFPEKGDYKTSMDSFLRLYGIAEVPVMVSVS